MIAQYKQNFLNKNFSHQDQDKSDDGLQKRIEYWNVGLNMLLIKEDQYRIMFIVLIITMKK